MWGALKRFMLSDGDVLNWITLGVIVVAITAIVMTLRPDEEVNPCKQFVLVGKVPVAQDRSDGFHDFRDGVVKCRNGKVTR